MTAELYAALRQAGVREEPAGTAARSVVSMEMLANLATKRDLADLRVELKADMQALRQELVAEIAGLRLELKADIATVRLQTQADCAELKVDLIKWNVGAMALLTAIFAAISRL